MLRQKADGLEANMRKTQCSRENVRERKVLGVGSRGLSMKSIGWTVGREEFTGKVISAAGRKPNGGDSRVPDPRADSMGEEGSERNQTRVVEVDPAAWCSEAGRVGAAWVAVHVL